MKTDIVTGAFSYTGKYITRRLLAQGRRVRTLTGHPDRTDAFKDSLDIFPYHFEQPHQLTAALSGCHTLYNTYWVRFPYGTLTYEKAVKNSRTLFQAAKKAGIQRIVHVSIANPSKESPLSYYFGKAKVEEALLTTGIPYAIFRPTVIFGKEDILINNIAWMIRHFPFFAIPGDGMYRLQPIYVEDFADALVDAGKTTVLTIQDAVGPESFSFNDLILMIAQNLDRKIRLIHVAPSVTYAATSLLSRFLGDVVLTKEEIQGLLDNLLVSTSRPIGKKSLTQWVQDHKQTLGRSYASELKRHF